MEENILKINYEVRVDIDKLANDIAIYLDDALSEQLESEERVLILDNEINEATLLSAVGKVWQARFVQKVINNKITSKKGTYNEVF